ncbi:MAG: hypothetical protein A2Y38_10835 [Spirochaetes bacterium GWB1_59_5]|nr:MAG: hypothetical protein A2Y38_10835 [Spirochaetes bacterium GWB1_59_5]
MTLVVAIASCENTALPSAIDERTGTVSITIPALGAAFLSAAGFTSPTADARAIGEDGPIARAFVAVSSVHFELYAADGTTLVDDWYMDEAAYQSGLDGGTGSFVQSRNIVPGTGYTIQATILNEANGSDEASRATVRGKSAPFKIVGGACSYILIVCKPLVPVVLEEGIPSEPVSLTPFEGNAGSWNEPAWIVPGGEKWYSFTATSKATRIIARCAEEGQSVLAMFVYDADATTITGTIGQSIGVEPGEGCATYATTTIGQGYYVGVIDLGTFKRQNIYPSSIPDSGGDHSFTVLFEKAMKDSYESDGTITSAKSLTLGETQTHSLYPLDDIDYVSFLAVTDTIYAVTTSSTDTAVTGTRVEILSADGIVVASPDNNMGWSEGFTSISAWTCPADGIYYIKISKGYGQIGEYNIKIAEVPPAQDVHVTVGPGVTDPHRTLLFSWDAVPSADLYQIWFSYVDEEGSGEPQPLFEVGEELRPADCTISGTRLSWETPAWFNPGDSAFIQVSWNVDGVWSSLSAGAEGATETETTISVIIR